MSETKHTFEAPVELLRKYDRPGPRYTSYPTAPTWSNEIDSNDYSVALRAAGENGNEPISIYCHIPFCVKRCYFCGCNTVIAKMSDRIDKYVDVVCAEIDQVASLTGRKRPIGQLHFGGGTPSFVEEQGLGRIVDRLREHFDFIDECETSIEIDPRVTSVELLEYLVEKDFNRISLGVQDFDEAVQKSVGRIQPYEMVEETLKHCRRLNFSGINFDLIYGLPLQTVEGFKVTLDKVITLRPDRLAVYSFAYLPSIKPHMLRIKQEDLPDTETKNQLFIAASEKFIEAGYHQIGMDHFALPDDELFLARHDGRLNRNFMGYTVQSSAEMIGIGMSSIGYMNDTFFQNHSKVDSYEADIDSKQFPIFRGKALNQDDQIRQYVISSLMCNFRLEFGALHEKFQIDYKDYFADEQNTLTELFEDKLIEQDNHRLQVTRLGRTFVRNIAMTFDAYLRKGEDKERPLFSRTI